MEQGIANPLVVLEEFADFALIYDAQQDRIYPAGKFFVTGLTSGWVEIKNFNKDIPNINEGFVLDFSGKITIIVGLVGYQPMIITSDSMKLIKKVMKLVLDEGVDLIDEGYSESSGHIYQRLL